MRDLTPLLHPRSIAVVGASSNLQSPSGKPVRFIRDSGVEVTVYPVNPAHEEIGGYRSYPDPSALPEAPDLAIVVVAASAVIPAVEALAERGTRAVIVITSGFGEGNRVEGAAAQRRLGEIARAHDMVMLGPNTLGIHDYVRGLPLSFVWYGRQPENRAGSVAVVSQSGSGMTSLCDRLIGAGLPIGFGVSTGNEADLTIVELLEHFAEDDAVKVVVAVFEEVRDGARFLAVCRRLHELGKPLVVLKVGRTEGGSAMVMSHTGALAGSYPVLTSVLRQLGVLEITDLDQIAPTVAAALLGKFPQIDGIAVVTNSGGAAAIAADRADELHVPLPVLGAAAQEKVRENLPVFAQDQPVHNPIDITAQNSRRPFAMADIASALVDDPSVGGVIVALASGGGPDGLVWTDRFAELVNTSAKPVLSVILSDQESAGLRARLRSAGVPVLSSPGVAVETLRLLRRVAGGDRAAEAPPSASADALPLPAGTTEYETLRWLASYGVPVADQRMATNADEAMSAAEKVGFPVAIKISSPQIVHKTEVGGVALGLVDAAGVREAVESVLAAASAARPDAVLEGVTVSPMVTPAVELIAGIHTDPTFGPVILLGIGGIWAEVLGDVALRVPPLAPDEADRMVDDLRGSALLRGARGRPEVDPNELRALVNALARIVAEHGDRIRSLDLNPVAVTHDGHLVVLDAALYLAEGQPAASAVRPI